MTVAKISSFERTLQKTNVWLKDVNHELGWDSSDHERAYHALRAVLHALRDRLPLAETTNLAAQLPMLIRSFYFDGWNPTKNHLGERRREQFLDRVAENYANDLTVDVEDLTRGVFRVIEKHITPGEIVDVKRALPEAILELWG